METAQILDLIAGLKLTGMRMSFEETLADGLKRRQTVQQILGAYSDVNRPLIPS